MERDLESILEGLKHEAEWIGLREVVENQSFHVARDGKIEKNSTSFDQGLMIEVLVDGIFVSAATNSFQMSEIQKAVKQAVQLAKAGAGRKIHTYHPGLRPKACGTYKSVVEIPFSEFSVGEIDKLLIDATNNLKGGSSKVVATHASIIKSWGRTRFVSSNGSCLEQVQNLLSSELTVTAEGDGQPQTRSSGHQVQQVGLEFLKDSISPERCEILSREVHELLQAPDCPSGRMDLLLCPNQMVLQIHESIGHPLEIDRILGDERNYAGKSFVSLDDFGKFKYGSELLNITFDPTLKNEAASYLFDDIGAAAKKEYIIKNGMLLRGLGSLESQERAQIPGVACTRATSWNRAPIDRMANLNLEVGKSSIDNMISTVEKGVYMQTNRSWSIDDYRNKFQFGCEYARLIEDGKLTSVVKNPNYRGISTSFWNSLKAVGNDETFIVGGSFYCGKGEPNQAIHVGHATPACLFESMEIFGGES